MQHGKSGQRWWQNRKPLKMLAIDSETDARSGEEVDFCSINAAGMLQHATA
jgi:hypothetical protein